MSFADAPDARTPPLMTIPAAAPLKGEPRFSVRLSELVEASVIDWPRPTEMADVNHSHRRAILGALQLAWPTVWGQIVVIDIQSPWPVGSWCLAQVNHALVRAMGQRALMPKEVPYIVDVGLDDMMPTAVVTFFLFPSRYAAFHDGAAARLCVGFSDDSEVPSVTKAWVDDLADSELTVETRMQLETSEAPEPFQAAFASVLKEDWRQATVDLRDLRVEEPWFTIGRCAFGRALMEVGAHEQAVQVLAPLDPVSLSVPARVNYYAALPRALNYVDKLQDAARVATDGVSFFTEINASSLASVLLAEKGNVLKQLAAQAKDRSDIVAGVELVREAIRATCHSFSMQPGDVARWRDEFVALGRIAVALGFPVRELTFLDRFDNLEGPRRLLRDVIIEGRKAKAGASPVFMPTHLDSRERKPGYVPYQCEWCSIVTFADPDSYAYRSGVCGDCRDVVRLDTAECPSHGEYLVFIKSNESHLGECRWCFDDRLRAERRQRGDCEICGARLGFLDRAAGRSSCKSHGTGH